MSLSEIFLSTAYLPPTEYFHLILNSERVLIENNENYTKQSYRNRCIIAGPNGKQTLVVPVLHGPDLKSPISETEIDYSKRWIPVHKGAIESAYRNAPFYDYYSEAIFSVLDTRPKYLSHLNMALIRIIAGYLSCNAELNLTTTFIKANNIQGDFRYLISPKNRFTFMDYSVRPYIQVFSDRFGFTDNLSIIDMLFNLGPQATERLR